MEDTDKERIKYAAFAVIAIAVFLVFAVRSYMASVNEGASQAASKAGEVSSFQDRKIDINAATEAELSTLPGIGPALAKRIVEKRGELKGFKAVEELTQVKGIGEKKLGALKDRITVSVRTGK